jgi:hypothetical protein
MSILRTAFALLILSSLGCAVSAEPAPEPTIGESEQAAERICPAIAILCIEGYHAKSVGNCKQVCVPDNEKTGCNPKCGANEYCSECKTIDGSALVCLPLGTAC